MPLMDYVNELKQQRDILVDILGKVGVEASTDETFNTLIPKILDIYGITYFIKVYDSFGVIAIEKNSDIQMQPFSESLNVSAQVTTQQGIVESFAPIQVETTDVSFDIFGESISSEIA